MRRIWVTVVSALIGLGAAAAAPSCVLAAFAGTNGPIVFVNNVLGPTQGESSASMTSMVPGDSTSNPLATTVGWDRFSAPSTPVASQDVYFTKLLSPTLPEMVDPHMFVRTAAGQIREITPSLVGYTCVESRVNATATRMVSSCLSVSTGYDIVMTDLTTGVSAPIVATPDVEAHPSFTPDGTGVIYERPNVGIFRAALDGSSETAIVLNGQYRSPELSPDGTKLAVSQATNRSLTIVDVANPASATVISTPPANWRDEWPSWSPDGTRIAFQRADTGSSGLSDIWTINPDGSGAAKLTAGRNPHWTSLTAAAAGPGTPPPVQPVSTPAPTPIPVAPVPPAPTRFVVAIIGGTVIDLSTGAPAVGVTLTCLNGAICQFTTSILAPVPGGTTKSLAAVRRVLIGRRTVRIARGKATKTTVTLNRVGRRMLKAAGRRGIANVLISTQAVTAGKGAATTTKTVRLRMRP